MQVDECSAGSAVTHTLHQFPQVRAHVSDQEIGSVAKVMHMNAPDAALSREATAAQLSWLRRLTRALSAPRLALAARQA